VANTATGDQALLNNTTGVSNAATGFQALFSNTIGIHNTATGFHALFSNTIGNLNTANGDRALLSNTTGTDNTAVGDSALLNNTTGSNNIALGNNVGSAVTTASNVICIGTGVPGANVNSTCFIGNVFGQTITGGAPVFISAAGQLGTITSSLRFKDNIKPMNNASESLFGLKPVTFHYKKEIDSASTAQFGLVAEEVEKVNPDLVVRDKDGKPYSVRYDQVNAMLLNEFLKEHRTVEQLKKDFESQSAEQQRQIEELSASLRQIKAQVDANKPTMQVALTHQ
jgi:hypothetical protein